MCFSGNRPQRPVSVIFYAGLATGCILYYPTIRSTPSSTTSQCSALSTGLTPTLWWVLKLVGSIHLIETRQA